MSHVAIIPVDVLRNGLHDLRTMSIDELAALAGKKKHLLAIAVPNNTVSLRKSGGKYKVASANLKRLVENIANAVRLVLDAQTAR